jgi:uncharacterized membrane protein YphA (DoxX/SURF4 family)
MRIVMNTITKKFPLVARVGLGLVFATFGLNKLVPFIPQPPISGAPAELFGALFATGYMIPLIAITEMIAGALLLSGRFVPLALSLLAPVIVNILAFHAFLAPPGIGMPLAVLGLELYLAWTYRDAFAPMLHARTTIPTVAADGMRRKDVLLAKPV